jgi:hypothetical protein
MRGFGSSPAGRAPAGAGLLITSAPPHPVLPRAIRYDPLSGRAIYDVNSELVDEHPVDHFVAMQIGFELGAIPSATWIGNDVRTALANAPEAKRQAVAELAIAKMLEVPIAAKDLRLGAVYVDTPSRNVVTFDYVNLRLVNQAAPAITSRDPNASTKTVG